MYDSGDFLMMTFLFVMAMFIGISIGNEMGQKQFSKECTGKPFVYENHIYKCENVGIK